MSQHRERTDPGEIERLRHAIAACERGIVDRSGATIASCGLPRQDHSVPSDRLPTGFDALDEAAGGGLHVGALNEVFTAAAGSGALEALLPAIARSGSGRRLIVWIHPTRAPYPPAIAQAGSDLERWLIVRPLSDEDHLWSIDQSLRSRACAAVIACLGDVHDRGLRRLQLSAREGGTVAIVLRPAALISRPSPASLRILAEPERAGDPRRRRVRMTLLRSRGTSFSDSSVILEMSRDPLDEHSSSWFAHRARGGDAAGREPAPPRTRSA